MLSLPNCWSDWLPIDETGPLSWAHFSALLLRRLPPEHMIETLAPILEKARLHVEQKLECSIQYSPLSEDWPIGYARYRAAFLDRCDPDVRIALALLGGNDDIRWFAQQARERTFHSTPMLWFLLGGIAHKCRNDNATGSHISEDCRWLAELDWECPLEYSALECLIEELYDEFRDLHPDHVAARSADDALSADVLDPFAPVSRDR